MAVGTMEVRAVFWGGLGWVKSLPHVLKQWISEEGSIYIRSLVLY